MAPTIASARNTPIVDVGPTAKLCPFRPKLISEQPTTTLQLLETQFLQSIQRENIITKDEEARNLRVQLLLQKEENEDLLEQLAFEDDRIDALEIDQAELQAHIERIESDAQEQQAELRLKEHELATLKVRGLSWVVSIGQG